MDKMDLQREFHMTGGVGKTSYARNSSFQVLDIINIFTSLVIFTPIVTLFVVLIFAEESL